MCFYAVCRHAGIAQM